MADMSTPLKNVAFTLSFTLYKNDGTIVANPGTYTKKVSVDGGAVADITASVTEEDTTYGQLSLALATGEMNGDFIWVYVTDDTAGTVPFTCSLYPAAGALASAASITAAKTVIDNIHDTDLPAVKADTAAILTDTGTTLDAALAVVDGNVDSLVTSVASFGNTDDVANAVWDETAADHDTAGSTGKELIDGGAGGGLDAAGVRGAVGLATANLDTQIAALPTDADVNAACDTAISDAALAKATNLATVDGIADSILSDTNELQVEWANGGRLDLILDGAGGGLDAAGIRAAIGMASANLDTQLGDIGTGSGSGSTTWTYTLTKPDTTPIAAADIWVTTDSGGSNVVASGVTDNFGVVTFHLDAGTYYVWSQKAGYNFTNPDTEVVS